ncbi:MmcQ/YjbR family DNA-binding protein [Actinomadura sp. 7K534]|uniref:MmcQ/YjbR family DNA-binding protein n=1 Tax=Actinomadura sp. 7K534 TaxID=2530366 RepID=UPI0010465598|nr:MmcQ/YjbR family DNA-binding protein [Actinomadura sp. 7K534]TDB94151.1 MmcQ/YjbR family DNA-binding protein [Actinomadura sp. 7K534]
MRAEEFLELVLSLPEVTEREAFSDLTGFRVRDKGFCYLNEDDHVVLLKATREEQAALIAEDPATYSPSWASGRFAWVAVKLATVAPEELAELVTEAWRLSAPKRLAKALST